MIALSIYNTILPSPNLFSNPYKFSDIDDILENRGKAWEFFQDLLVNRPTEFSAFIRLYLIASRNLDEKRLSLTARQNEAIRYAREAVQRNVHPTRYVAEKLGGITHRAVQRLLKRASLRVEAEMFASQIQRPVPINNKRSKWSPTEKQIRAKMASLTRECAACSKPIPGRFALCYECGTRFGFDRESWLTSKRPGESAPAKWLIPEARRLDREQRRRAVNELYRARGFEGDDFENLMEQKAG